MSELQWYDLVRLLTAVLALVTMYMLARSWRLRSNDYTNRLKDFWWSTNAMLFAVVVGSLERVIRNQVQTLSIIITFLAVVVSLKASINKNAQLIRDDPYNEDHQTAPRNWLLGYLLDLGWIRNSRRSNR